MYHNTEPNNQRIERYHRKQLETILIPLSKEPRFFFTMFFKLIIIVIRRKRRDLNVFSNISGHISLVHSEFAFF